MVIGGVVRLSAARNLSLHVDEAATILASQQIAERGYPILPSGAVYLQGALFSYLIAPLSWLDISPVDHLIGFRLPSVVAGTVAIYVLFRLGHAVIGRFDAALFAAALLAVDPLSVRWSGLSRMYSLLQAISLALIWLFARMMSRPLGIGASVGFVALFSAGVFTHIAVCLLVVPMFIVAWFGHGRDLLGRRRDIAVTLSACLIAPILFMGLNRLDPPPGEPVEGSSVRFAFVGDYLLSLDHVLRPDFGAWLATFRDLPSPEIMAALMIGTTGFLVAWYLAGSLYGQGPRFRPTAVWALVIFYWVPVLLVAAFAIDAENRYLVHVHPLGFLILALVAVELTESSRQIASTRVIARGVRSARSYPLPDPIREDSVPEAVSSRTRVDLALTTKLAFWVLPVLVAALARVPLVSSLSLWLDEGFTVLYSRLPWASVLGLNGFYSPHPPAYFAAVKAVSLVLPDAQAGRAISVIAAVATVPVVGALTKRLLGARAAFVAALTVALSPVHVYYAQEARMYALVVLLVALSYLALVTFIEGPSWRWAAAYGLAIVAALYVDYSAAIAVLPQALVIGYALDRHRRSAIPILVASAFAVLAYLPWLPQVIDSVRAANQVERREAYLGDESNRVPDVILGLVGLAGTGNYVHGSNDMLWVAVPALRPVLILVTIAVILLGAVTLMKRQLAAVVAVSAVGAIPVAIWVGQISPAFAERTVLSAVVGWALIVGACASAPISTERGKLAVGAVASALLISLAGAIVIDSGATKQRWEDAAHELTRNDVYGYPVVTYSYGHVADVFLDIYAPHLSGNVDVVSIRDGELEPVLSNDALPDRGMTLAEARAGGLAESLSKSGSPSPYVWVLYYIRPGSDEVLAAMSELGYERIRFGEYWTPRYRLYLDLFSIPGTIAGKPVPINGGFTDNAEGWVQSPAGATVVESPEGSALLLAGSPGIAPVASFDRPGPQGLYEVTVEFRADFASRDVRIALECVATDGSIASDSLARLADPPDNESSEWNTARLAVICPDETTVIRVVLGSPAFGQVEFRSVELFLTNTTPVS